VVFPTPDPSAALTPYQQWVAASVAQGESMAVTIVIVYFLAIMLSLFALGAIMVLGVRR
jgi:hypothetical protein